MRTILRRLREVVGAPVDPILPEEIYLPALEERWTVRYNKSSARTVQARCSGDGSITVSGRIKDVGKVKGALRRWLVRQTRNALVPWLEELSEQAELPYGSVSVRGQKTRWASCSLNGNINLNYKLLFLSPDVVRYILNHELCHTVHPNHSKRFWSKVSTLEPGYKGLNSSAKKGMEEVPEWVKRP